MSHTVQYEITIAAPLQRVWDLFEDPTEALTALSPAKMRVVVESADLPMRAGSRVVVRFKRFLGTTRWVSKIVEWRPPHAVVFGEEARFVDEQEVGPFKYWRHEHEFEAIDSKHTRVIDRVTFRAPGGPLAWIAHRLIVRPILRAMFRQRHRVMHQLLDERTTSPITSSAGASSGRIRQGMSS